MFAGPSGVGKTTLAKQIYQGSLPYVSGSISDLLPQTKDIPHKDMLSRDSKTLQIEDYQVLNLRQKVYKDIEGDLSSDRSFLDLAAYFIYKQADKIPQCEVEHFLNLCSMCNIQQCTHLIFIPFTMEMFNNWVIEDNNKRITSKYFQMEISQIMNMVLKIWGYRHFRSYNRIPTSKITIQRPKYLNYGWDEGFIRNLYGTTRVLIMKEANLEDRINIINSWLKED